jgi:hypothetical protein
MATGTASSFIVQNFADDTPKRVRLSTVENPLKPGSDQLAAIQGKIKVNPSVLEPITLPATRQNFDAAIERGQLGAAKRDASDLSSSTNAAAQRGLMSTFLKG